MTESKTRPFATIAATPFTEAERAAVYRAIYERRDMRHFAGGKVADEVLLRLLRAAHHAPSVGFMQPWRFIRVRSAELRRQIHGLIEEERVRTAHALGAREEDFMKLKVQGVLDAAEVLVVAMPPGREGAYLRPSHLARDGYRQQRLCHPEPLAGRASRRVGHGLGFDFRSAGAGQTAADA